MTEDHELWGVQEAAEYWGVSYGSAQARLIRAHVKVRGRRVSERGGCLVTYWADDVRAALPMAGTLDQDSSVWPLARVAKYLGLTVHASDKLSSWGVTPVGRSISKGGVRVSYYNAQAVREAMARNGYLTPEQISATAPDQELWTREQARQHLGAASLASATQALKSRGVGKEGVRPTGGRGNPVPYYRAARVRAAAEAKPIRILPRRSTQSA